MVNSSPYYEAYYQEWDNPHWEWHLPINPPGAYREASDVVLLSCDVANWLDDDGIYRFRPRIKDVVQQ